MANLSRKTAHRIIIDQLKLEQERLRNLLANDKGGLTNEDVAELMVLDQELTKLEKYAAEICDRIEGCAERVKNDGA